MVTLLGCLAVACCGLFAGAALYVNLVEHPARMSNGVESALREWAPSYKRGAEEPVWGAQALAAGTGYLVGALLILAAIPYTLLVIRQTNTRLLALHAAGQVGNAHELLARWNRLHAVRTALGLAAFVVMLGTIAR